jgi:hypothetical protein
VSTAAQKELSTIAQENVFQENHEGSSWENGEKLEWAWTKIWLIECINILSYLSLEYG